ncbi:SDR family oxidoreductase [Humidisolicoccus flavus]|uniref:SDR family oxidoreductase n=1 Tax=Humidisolicoccus flavus TaxID=3111414 RepID=UPI003255ECD4
MNQDDTPIGITGSTGFIGGRVAAMLSEQGANLRLLVRDASRAPQLPASSLHECGYGDFEASKRALEGVATLLMVSGAESADRLAQHRTFVDAAAAAGVRHVVYTSFAAAAPDATFTLARDHFHTEAHIKSSGMHWTFLRDSFYMDVMEPFVGEDSVIRGPGGNGKVALVARADVARAAAVILSKPNEHLDTTYDLTGPEALSFAEVASTISDVRGTEVQFYDESLEEAYESRASYGVPDWQVEAWVSTYTAVASNVMATVSGDVERITGAPPMRFEQYLSATDARTEQS